MHNRTQVFLIAIIIIIVLGVIAFAAVFLNNKGGSQSEFTETTTTPISSSDHVRGLAASQVTLIEYGDFECPACGEYEPIIEQLMQDYGNKVAFVFRNFPLYQIHPNAMAGAEAAEAAGIQGKYWEMHDLLYAKQNQWANAVGGQVQQDLDSYAASLNLDVAKFDADMKSGAVTGKIQADLKSGNDAEINHTPTFFVNGKQIPQPSAADLKSDLDAALAAS